jgi:hypothetical protein
MIHDAAHEIGIRDSEVVSNKTRYAGNYRYRRFGSMRGDHHLFHVLPCTRTSLSVVIVSSTWSQNFLAGNTLRSCKQNTSASDNSLSAFEPGSALWPGLFALSLFRHVVDRTNDLVRCLLTLFVDCDRRLITGVVLVAITFRLYHSSAQLRDVAKPSASTTPAGMSLQPTLY